MTYTLRDLPFGFAGYVRATQENNMLQHSHARHDICLEYFLSMISKGHQNAISNKMEFIKPVYLGKFCLKNERW